MAHWLRVPRLSGPPPLRAVAASRLESHVLGGCRLLRRLSVGARSEVYLAQRIDLDNRLVAIKVVRPEAVTCSPEEVACFKQRFMQEGAILSRLTHPNILPVHDCGLENGWLYLVMQYVPDGSLADAIHRRGPDRLRLRLPLRVSRATDLVYQIASALYYLHQHGVVHRAVNPSNMLVQIQPDGRWRVLLTDFAIARAVEGTARAGQAGYTSQAGQVTDATAYVAPEQLNGRCSPASDQYALGVLAYLLLAGRVPFARGISDQRKDPFSEEDYESPPPLRSLNRAVPLELAAVIGRALAKNPADRWPSMATFAQAFQWATTGERSAIAYPSDIGPEILTRRQGPAAASPVRVPPQWRAPDRLERPPADASVEASPLAQTAQTLVGTSPPAPVSTHPINAPPALAGQTNDPEITWPNTQRRGASPAILPPPHREGWKERWRPTLFAATVALLLLAMVAAVQINPPGTSRGFHPSASATRGVPTTVRPTTTRPPLVIDKAQLVAASVLRRAAPRQRVTFRFTFRNTGTTVWSARGGYGFACDVTRHPTASCKGLRVVGFGRTRVAPGRQITFRTVFIAPRRPGTYEFWWNLERGGLVFNTPGAHVSLTVRVPLRPKLAPTATPKPRHVTPPKPAPTATPRPQPTATAHAKPKPVSTSTKVATPTPPLAPTQSPIATGTPVSAGP